MLSLCHAHCVVQGCGQVSFSTYERNTRGGVGAQALGCARLLRETRRWHGYDTVADGQRNSQPAEETSAEARTLAADAEDGGIGGLPADVCQERHRRLGPGLGYGYVDVAIGVAFDGWDSHRGAQLGVDAVLIVEQHCLLACRAGDKLVVGAHHAAYGDTGHPLAKLSIVEYHHLAVKDVHAVEVPKLAKIRRDRNCGGRRCGSQDCIGQHRCARAAVAELVDAARISHFSAACEAFSEANGLNIANHLGGIDKVEAHGRVRKEMPLLRVNNICGWGKEPTGLPFKGEVLGGDRP